MLLRAYLVQGCSMCDHTVFAPERFDACPACGYSLCGHDDDAQLRCPECGAVPSEVPRSSGWDLPTRILVAVLYGVGALILIGMVPASRCGCRATSVAIATNGMVPMALLTMYVIVRSCRKSWSLGWAWLLLTAGWWTLLIMDAQL